MTDFAEVDRAVAAAVGRFGAIDVLVNNAGTNIQQDALDVTEDAWDTIMDVNLKATFFVSQRVAREMIRMRRGGRIVSVSSQMGAVGFYKRATYCASKGGVVQLTKSLAREYAAQNIRVNAVAPGWTESPMTRGLVDEDRVQAVSRTMALRKVAQPEDVARQVVVLASDELSGHVTGQVIVVAGGMEGRVVHE